MRGPLQLWGIKEWHAHPWVSLMTDRGWGKMLERIRGQQNLLLKSYSPALSVSGCTEKSVNIPWPHSMEGLSSAAEKPPELPHNHTTIPS